jgi:phosphoribosyl 1,2-cyclic phosphodiesterase
LSRLRFAYLGSGSRGNAAVIQAGRTTVMLDCGFSAAEAGRRLERLRLEGTDVAALVVTHEHGDHISGVARFARRYGVPVWMTPGTARVAPDLDIPELNLFSCHEAFAIGDLRLAPAPVPHDAREPCQFVFSDGDRALGILTDLGHVSRHVAQAFASCDALVVECNHDPELLEQGPYPRSVKTRVGGDLGHLNNGQAAALVAELDASVLSHLVAVHVSETNNRAELARRALAAAAGAADTDIEVARQDEGLDWRSV